MISESNSKIVKFIHRWSNFLKYKSNYFIILREQQHNIITVNRYLLLQIF